MTDTPNRRKDDARPAVPLQWNEQPDALQALRARDELENNIVRGAAQLLDMLGVGAFQLPIPDTEPMRYVVAGTLSMIAAQAPTLDAILNCYSPDDTVGDYQDKIRALWASAAQAPEDARAFLMSQDLYSLLMDIQNGIDSPATCGLANKLIIRLDKVRDSLATPAAPTCTPADEQDDDLTSRIAHLIQDNTALTCAKATDLADVVLAFARAAQGAGTAPVGAAQQGSMWTMADAFSIFQDLTQALDAIARGDQDSEEIASIMLRKTDALHPRFLAAYLAATHPAPVSTAAAPEQKGGAA